jgi:hypothetical protein
LATDEGEFVIDFDDLAQRAGCSRDKLDRNWRILRDMKWTSRQRISRNEYRVLIDIPAKTTNFRSSNPRPESGGKNVNSGTPAKSTEVRSCVFGTHEKAMAILEKLRR